MLTNEHCCAEHTHGAPHVCQCHDLGGALDPKTVRKERNERKKRGRGSGGETMVGWERLPQHPDST